MDDEGERITTERLMALGMVIEWAADMERALQDAFCALVGSKFAVVIAGGQTAGGLIDQCLALVSAHWELTDAARDEIKSVLLRCKDANLRRNDLVHGVKTASRSDGSLQTLRSSRNRHTPTLRGWTLAEIRETATELSFAGRALTRSIEAAVGPEMASISWKLAAEERRRSQASDGA